MPGIKLQIDLPKPEKDNKQVSALVSELKGLKGEIRALKGSSNSKVVIENKISTGGAVKNPLKPKERVIKVKDTVSAKKVTALEKALKSVKVQLKKKPKVKVIHKTVVKKQVVRERVVNSGDDTNLVKHLKAIRDSVPTTSHIGGNI